MAEKIEVYGTVITLPEQPDFEHTVNYGLPRKEQKWKRQLLPEYFDKVEIDKQGELLLTPQQEKYAASEIKKCKEGIWIWIGEKLRYFPKRYYFYLQYYTLEDGNAPDFREADRLYYLFFEWWFLVLWVLGIIRTKKRRQGASSQSCSNILYEAIFFRNSNCGLISKTKEDSKDTFTQMITAAYRQLPIFLKPRQVNKEDSVTELVFAHKSQTNKQGFASAIKEEEGHNSKINYKAPVLNAYDRGRMSYVLGDEFGKLAKEVPASQLLAIIAKTLVKGVKRVGWIDLPSTVNEMSKGGGAEYKIIWDKANQFKKKPTVNRLVRIFQPAFEAYEGFIDEFGDSVIGVPTQEQYEYLVQKWVKYSEDGELISELSEEDILLGAKHYVLFKRREGLEGSSLEEEIRMNPCTEDEAFLSAVSDCHFNSINLKKQQKYLEENEVPLRTVTFFKTANNDVSWRDDEQGFWKILAFPEYANRFKMDGRLKRPDNTSNYVMGVDGYSNSQGGRKYGSNAAGFVFKRFNIVDPENSGLFVAMYFGRPRTKDLFHEQLLLASIYYGCQCWIEHTADSYKEYFTNMGGVGYLGRYPASAIDPNKRENADRFYGFPINPFAMGKQLDSLIAYVDNDPITKETFCTKIYFNKLLEQMLVFEAEDRTKSDAVVAAMIALVCGLEQMNKPNKIDQPLIKVYSNN